MARQHEGGDYGVCGIYVCCRATAVMARSNTGEASCLSHTAAQSVFFSGEGGGMPIQFLAKGGPQVCFWKEKARIWHWKLLLTMVGYGSFCSQTGVPLYHCISVAQALCYQHQQYIQVILDSASTGTGNWIQQADQILISPSLFHRNGTLGNHPEALESCTAWRLGWHATIFTSCQFLLSSTVNKWPGIAYFCLKFVCF